MLPVSWTTIRLFLHVLGATVWVDAAFHARARSRPSLAVFGALSGLTALGALLLGVLLAG